MSCFHKNSVAPIDKTTQLKQTLRQNSQDISTQIRILAYYKINPFDPGKQAPTEASRAIQVLKMAHASVLSFGRPEHSSKIFNIIIAIQKIIKCYEPKSNKRRLEIYYINHLLESLITTYLNGHPDTTNIKARIIRQKLYQLYHIVTIDHQKSKEQCACFFNCFGGIIRQQSRLAKLIYAAILSFGQSHQGIKLNKNITRAIDNMRTTLTGRGAQLDSATRSYLRHLEQLKVYANY